ncbi:UNVERIFIED_ORG: hypothetical protein BDU10_9678 [Burkholderia sp. CF145]|nr:hypothetical protein PMI06_009932 [Burkholderia sp. BT03]SKC46179.1 hypothetical protein SAMN06266956_0084 [Paraburkholderia hospita]
MLLRCVTADALFGLGLYVDGTHAGKSPSGESHDRAAFSDWNESSVGTFTSSSISGQNSC